MVRRFTIKILMDLAKRIGGSYNKWGGTRANITFLGKGPTKNPLFQSPIAGPETSKVLLGPDRIKGTISSVNDAMGYASAGKLNTIQTEILGKNLLSLKNILEPPVLPSLPMASVTALRPGIEGLKRFPRETHKFFGRPLKGKDFSEIDTMVAEGKLPGPGIGKGVLDAKIGMSRAIARQILQQDTRLKLKPEEIFSLKSGGKGADPLELMQKYYGRSVTNFDDFLNSVNIEAASPTEFAKMVLKNVELIPQFAEGGLADILQAPRRGRVVHPGGYAGTGKRQAFIDLARAGGSRQDFIDLAGSFRRKSIAVPIDPFKELTIYDMLMSGALPSELKHGGLARILEV